MAVLVTLEILEVDVGPSSDEVLTVLLEDASLAERSEEVLSGVVEVRTLLMSEDCGPVDADKVVGSGTGVTLFIGEMLIELVKLLDVLSGVSVVASVAEAVGKVGTALENKVEIALSVAVIVPAMLGCAPATLSQIP